MYTLFQNCIFLLFLFSLLFPPFSSSRYLSRVYSAYLVFLRRHIPFFLRPGGFATLSPILELIRLLVLYHDPELGVALAGLEVHPAMFAVAWVLTGLAKHAPLEAVSSLWDALITEGDPMLMIYVCTALLLRERDAIMLAAQSGAHIPPFLARLPLVPGGADMSPGNAGLSSPDKHKYPPTRHAHHVLLLLQRARVIRQATPLVVEHIYTYATADLEPEEGEGQKGSSQVSLELVEQMVSQLEPQDAISRRSFSKSKSEAVSRPRGSLTKKEKAKRAEKEIKVRRYNEYLFDVIASLHKYSVLPLMPLSIQAQVEEASSIAAGVGRGDKVETASPSQERSRNGIFSPSATGSMAMTVANPHAHNGDRSNDTAILTAEPILPRRLAKQVWVLLFAFFSSVLDQLRGPALDARSQITAKSEALRILQSFAPHVAKGKFGKIYGDCLLYINTSC